MREIEIVNTGIFTLRHLCEQTLVMFRGHTLLNFFYRNEEEVFHFDHTVVPKGLITMRSRMI